MAYLYYTITALLLYLFSDWIVNQIERTMGKRLKYRSVLFFVIILVLATSTFEIIDRIVGDPPQNAATPAETLGTDQESTIENQSK